MAVPMLVGDRVVGVLDVQADEVGRISSDDEQDHADGRDNDARVIDSPEPLSREKLTRH